MLLQTLEPQLEDGGIYRKRWWARLNSNRVTADHPRVGPGSLLFTDSSIRGRHPSTAEQEKFRLAVT